MDNPDQITYFADTDARNRRVRFGIKAEDRTRHVYVIGKTGMGKSTLLENMAVQDIRNGNGFAFMDPHGKTAELLLEYIPPERADDVIYFAPFDIENPISFNVMEDVGYDKRHLVVSGLMSTFKKIWVDAWSARMEYILGNTLLALLEYPDATLLEVNRMMSDKDFRKKVVDNVTDPAVKSFWVDEFAKYTDRFAAEATPAIQNKIGQFTANPLIRNIIGQPKSSFDLRKIMDDKKIIIINLSKGQVGEQNANLLGSMLITKIYLASLSRADVTEAEMKTLPNFYLYVDEFQSFANESFANILSEARKYKLNLTIAHQYIEQMSDEVRAAVFGNVGTMITFRVGSYDAEVLEKEFAPTFTAEDIVNLGAYQIYLRLMIDGIGSKPFSAGSMPPLEKPEVDSVAAIKENSRRRNTKPRAEVEKLVNDNMSGASNGGGNGGNGGNGGGNGNGGNGSRGGFKKNGNGSSGDNSGGNGNGNGNGNGSRKPNFDKRSKTQTLNSNGANNFSKPSTPKKKTVIDEKTKAELMKALEKDTFDDSGKNNKGKDDVTEISLNDLQTNTKQMPIRTPNKKAPSKENTNSLKEALGAILGDKSIQENESKKVSMDVDAVINSETESTDAPETFIEKIHTFKGTEKVEKVEKKEEGQVEKTAAIKGVEKRPIEEKNKVSQPTSEESREFDFAAKREIPEKDLKDVLGLE